MVMGAATLVEAGVDRRELDDAVVISGEAAAEEGLVALEAHAATRATGAAAARRARGRGGAALGLGRGRAADAAEGGGVAGVDTGGVGWNKSSALNNQGELAILLTSPDLDEGVGDGLAGVDIQDTDVNDEGDTAD